MAKKIKKIKLDSKKDVIAFTVVPRNIEIAERMKERQKIQSLAKKNKSEK